MRLAEAVSEPLRRYWASGLYALLASVVIWWIGKDATTTRLITFSQGADFWEHSAALRALLNSPFSPGNPHLALDTPSPRYTPIFWLLGVVGHVCGAKVLQLTAIASCLHVSMFLGGIYWFFASYFEDRRAPVIAGCVLLMGWWEGWHYSNVYQLQMLPSVASYPSTSALGLSFMAFAWVARVLRQGATLRRLVGVACFAALVLLVHPLTAAMAYVGVVLMIATEPGATRKVRLSVLGAGAVGAFLSHFWPFYSPFEVLSGGSGVTAGWIGKAMALSGKRKLHQFYRFKELVLAFGVALPGVYFLTRMLHLRKHLFAPLGFGLTFGIFLLNAFVSVPLGHRFVLLSMVFVHIGMVWGCLQVLPGVQRESAGSAWTLWGTRILLALLLVVGMKHNLHAAETRKRRVAGSASSSTILRYARQVGAHAGEGAVVMGRRRDSWSVPTFGPRVVALYHPNPLVADARERRRQVARFFSKKVQTPERRRILERYAVTHVLAHAKQSKLLRDIIGGRPAQRLAMGYRLYDVRSSRGDKPQPDAGKQP